MNLGYGVESLRTVDDRALAIAIQSGAVYGCQVFPWTPTVDGITSTAETVAHICAQRATHDSCLELHCKKRIAAANHQFGDFPLAHRPSEHRRLGDDFVGSRLNLNGLAHTADSKFGVGADTATSPPGTLALGWDGALYGTTSSGGDSTGGTVYRLNTNGTGYMVLYNFGALAGDGRSPIGPLALGTDHAFYGATVNGGDLGFGTLFRLLVPPWFSSITKGADNNIHLVLNGFPGITYRLDASSDLANWVTLTNLTSPVPAIPFTDSNAINFSRRFYRAVWIP